MGVGGLKGVGRLREAGRWRGTDQCSCQAESTCTRVHRPRDRPNCRVRVLGKQRLACWWAKLANNTCHWTVFEGLMQSLSIISINQAHSAVGAHSLGSGPSGASWHAMMWHENDLSR